MNARADKGVLMSSAEGARRIMTSEELMEVGRRLIVNGLEGDTSNFEDDTLMNGELIKFPKGGGDAFMTFDVEDNPGKRILYGLQSF